MIQEEMEYKEVKGSIAKRLRAAAFNHHQEHILRAKQMEKELNNPEPMPITNESGLVPETLKPFVLNTKGSMVRAGMECEHCLGGYARYPSENEVFFRNDEDICAQVRITEKGIDVVQSYDKKDQITSKSTAFERLIYAEYSKFRKSDLSKKLVEFSSNFKKQRTDTTDYEPFPAF